MQLIRKMLLLTGIYSLHRLLFLLFNLDYFQESESKELVLSFFYGLRYDINALTILNLPVILLHFFPPRWYYRRPLLKLEKALLYSCNIPFLLFNCIDLSLFQFSGRRITADVLTVLGFGNDFLYTLPKMVLDFWQPVLIFLVLVWILVRLYGRIVADYPARITDAFNFRPIPYLATLFLFLFLSFVGFRGGMQLKPLSILSASKYATGRETPLILNSSFTVLKTLGKDELRPVDFFPEHVAHSLSPVIHHPDTGAAFRPKNVVIIILEGIGREYIGFLNKHAGYTPFLDSLFRHSLVFRESFANSKRSIEGVPAVLAGIPALMDQPYISSAYSGNTINTVASLLKEQGYSTHFFHGGTNGTMGFENFCKIAGFDKYYGRKQYNNDTDFDGNWGIYDGPFLQWMKLNLDRMKEPFMASVFTLSSHHPYKLPEPYDKQLPKGKLAIHKSVRYTDLCLKNFFMEAEKSAWFRNTLFVITSDHTSLSAYPFYRGKVGMFAVPIAFYAPGDSLKGVNTSTTQQIDILPSILDYLNYPLPYFALGRSVFDRDAVPVAVTQLNGNYQMISNGYSYQLDTLDHPHLFNYFSDPLLRRDIYRKENDRAQQMDSMLKAIVQNYNHALLRNRMVVPASANVK